MSPRMPRPPGLAGHRQPAPVRGGRARARRRARAGPSPPCLDEAPEIPVNGWSPSRSSRHPTAIAAAPARGRQLAPVASASSPGCTRSRRPRCGSPDWTDLRRPLVHLHTQFNRDLPWAEVDSGLHEPPPVRPRRSGVRVHPDPAAARPQDSHWSLAGPAGRGASRLGWARAAAGWHESHRLRIARFGDNMREVAVTDGDKVEARPGSAFSVNGYGVADLVERVAACAGAEVDHPGRQPTPTDYELAPSLGSGRATDTRSSETAARIEGGLRVVNCSTTTSAGLHRHVRGPGARSRRTARASASSG